MPIKWGSTTCTVIEWGNTQCSAVYWGNTLVYPGYSGKVLYDGNTFFSPATRCKCNNSGTVFTSGSIYETYPSMPTKTTFSMTFGGETSNGYYNSMDLSSYNYVIIEFNSTTTNISLSQTVELYDGYSTILTYSSKFTINDISSVNSRKTAIKINIICQAASPGTIYITKVIVC